MRPARIVAATLVAIGCAAVPATQAQDIGEVLARSQQARLAMLVRSDDAERTARVRASLERLREASRTDLPLELMVMRGGVQAEAMLGRLLVVGEAVADLPEHERLALLAHELGHLVLGHWQALNALYRRHIPGEVRPETTDPVAGVLGREAHEQSHRHEFEADAFGFALVRRLGVGLDDELSLLMRQPVAHDTATHPATRRRLAQLRAIEARWQDEARLAGQGAVPLRAAQETATPR